MKALQVLCVFALASIGSVVALAQDPVKVDPEHYKVVLDNPKVRILKIDYPVGGKSPMHSHPDSIVIPLASSKARFTMPDGKSEENDLASESALYIPAGSHSSTNAGGGPVDAILVEFKATAPGKATVPTSRQGLSMKMLAEGAHAVAYRTTADATFQEPAGSTHDYDQVVIALSAAQMSLSIDGKPARTTFARGDVEFIGRGVAHESKNTGGKPVDYVIVAVR